MNVLASTVNVPLIITLAIIGVIVLTVAAILFNIYVLVPLRYRQQIRDLDKKASYLDALLVGQDAQYIHRLEIISRSNLLYVDKHELFSKRFKDILENDDKYTRSIIDQLQSLAENKQYKSMKKDLEDAKNAVSAFENKIIELDNDLYALIRPEEETRQAILQLKESYRTLKQTFNANVNDLELVSKSFEKVFLKLDNSFVEFENLVECADYDSANNMIPQTKNVIFALVNALKDLPNLCLLATSVIPEKISDLQRKYETAESNGFSLYNIGFKTKNESWQMILNKAKEDLVSLRLGGVSASLDSILNDIAQMNEQLAIEENDKEYFGKNIDSIYASTIELEKSYFNLCSVLPTIRNTYLIEEAQENDIADIKVMMEKLGSTKRSLDNYVHSNTKQPYSVLKRKLDDLKESYEAAYKRIADFKTYLDSVKTLSEEAFSLVFVYFYRCKQIESMLREMDIDLLSSEYESKLDNCYQLINAIDILIQNKPINVTSVNEQVEQLKSIANVVFDDVEETYRQMQLAENAIVYANRDRNRQIDVDQQLQTIEESFFAGEFDKVYRDASGIYSRNHVEDSNNV